MGMLDMQLLEAMAPFLPILLIVLVFLVPVWLIALRALLARGDELRELIKVLSELGDAQKPP